MKNWWLKLGMVCWLTWPAAAWAQEEAGFGTAATGGLESAATEVQSQVGQLQSIFGGASSLGCNLVYLGSYDDVNITYARSSENVAGEVIAADGTAKGSCYLEALGDKTQAGVQRFRYETEFGSFDPSEAVQVNPLDPRGQSSSGLEKKKVQLQRLSTDLAPFYQFPNLVVLLREEFFNTQVQIKDSYASEIQYLPYADNTEATSLISGTTYWIDIHLEELALAYDTHLFGFPARFSYFDLVYQKPVLVQNAEGSLRPYDLYHPKFVISGVMLQVSQIPLPWVPGVTLDMGYGASSEGVMQLSDPLSDSPLDEETIVEMTRTEVGVHWQYAQSWELTYRGEYMWISLVDEATQEESLISLDAINYLSLTYRW